MFDQDRSFKFFIISILFLPCFYLHSIAKSNLNCLSELTSNVPVWSYNEIYPLTTPIISNNITKFRIGIIADLDQKSLSDKKHTWKSYLKRGYLNYDNAKESVFVNWDSTDPDEIEASFSLNGMYINFY